eukprot:4314895-Prorocentrum_lima.AAC.1
MDRSTRSTKPTITSDRSGSEAPGKKPMGDEDVQMYQRDGRVCVLCGEKDTSVDPVKLDEFLHWGYAPRLGTDGSPA